MDAYEWLSTIGEGTYGVVLHARHAATGVSVAIKRFKDEDRGEGVRKTALREVRILKALRHDNIVQLLDVFRRKRRLYLVFEYMDGTLLDEMERRGDGLSSTQVRCTMWQLCRAVAYMHTSGVIHRDIKPENLLLSSSGVLKVCDFGFARALAGPGARYTDYVSTRWYRAPELLVGDTAYGKPVDVWAAGCILAEMVTGVPLFPGESDVDQLNCIMRVLGSIPPRMLETFHRNPLFAGVALPKVADPETLEVHLQQGGPVDPQIIDVIAKCLKYEPLQRITAQDLLRHPYFGGMEEWFGPILRACLDKDGSRDVMAHIEAERKARQQDGAAPHTGPVKISYPMPRATPPAGSDPLTVSAPGGTPPEDADGYSAMRTNMPSKPAETAALASGVTTAPGAPVGPTGSVSEMLTMDGDGDDDNSLADGMSQITNTSTLIETAQLRKLDRPMNSGHYASRPAKASASPLYKKTPQAGDARTPPTLSPATSDVLRHVASPGSLTSPSNVVSMTPLGSRQGPRGEPASLLNILRSTSPISIAPMVAPSESPARVSDAMSPKDGRAERRLANTQLQSDRKDADASHRASDLAPARSLPRHGMVPAAEDDSLAQLARDIDKLLDINDTERRRARAAAEGSLPHVPPNDGKPALQPGAPAVRFEEAPLGAGMQSLATTLRGARFKQAGQVADADMYGMSEGGGMEQDAPSDGLLKPAHLALKPAKPLKAVSFPEYSGAFPGAGPSRLGTDADAYEHRQVSITGTRLEGELRKGVREMREIADKLSDDNDALKVELVARAAKEREKEVRRRMDPPLQAATFSERRLVSREGGRDRSLLQSRGASVLGIQAGTSMPPTFSVLTKPLQPAAVHTEAPLQPQPQAMSGLHASATRSSYGVPAASSLTGGSRPTASFVTPFAVPPAASHMTGTTGLSLTVTALRREREKVEKERAIGSSYGASVPQESAAGVARNPAVVAAHVSPLLPARSIGTSVGGNVRDRAVNMVVGITGQSVGTAGLPWNGVPRTGTLAASSQKHSSYAMHPASYVAPSFAGLALRGTGTGLPQPTSFVVR